MAGKEGKAKGKKAGAKGGKKENEPETEESKVKLPKGSIQVMSRRDREWLSPAPPAPAADGGAKTGAAAKPRTLEDLEARRKADRAMTGKRVVDGDGLELGFVDEIHGDNITVGEGPFGDWLKITRSYVGEIDDEVHLLEPLQDLLEDLEVVDSKGRNIGRVREVVATGDIVDGLVVETEGGELYVLLEDICCIGGDLSLDIPYEKLIKQEANRKKGR
jgi:hypothetical protein